MLFNCLLRCPMRTATQFAVLLIIATCASVVSQQQQHVGSDPQPQLERPFLWEERDAGDYEPVVEEVLEDEVVEADYSSVRDGTAESESESEPETEAEGSKREQEQAEQNARAQEALGPLDWLTAFSSVCENRSEAQSPTARSLSQVLRCADGKRTLPFQCQASRTGGAVCTCTTLYGLHAVDSQGTSVFYTFEVARNATADDILDGAQRCLPESLVLELAVQFNTSAAAQHSVSVQQEAVWLAMQTRSWLSAAHVTTFGLESNAVFDYIGAATLDSHCGAQAWFTRWQIALRVNSSVFESELAKLLHFVRTRNSFLLLHNFPHRVVRLCVKPFAQASAAAHSLYCNASALDDVSQERFASLCSRSVTAAAEPTAFSSPASIRPAALTPAPASLGGPPGAFGPLPVWLVLLIVLLCSFAVALACTTITCCVRSRRKNKGSYKVQLDFGGRKAPSAAAAAAARHGHLHAKHPRHGHCPPTHTIFATHTDNAGGKANVLVSLNQPLMHDYSSGPPSPEFFA